MLGFVSMFVVVPYLSSNQTIYGIYSICISITVFLAYADLGFLGAGQKYAAECYAKGDLEKEIEYVGFSHFILLIMVLLISGIFLYLSFNPDKLISELSDPEQRNIASKLLLILAIFTPVIVVQRMLQMLFGIRLKEYNLQKINIVGSILKIMSVFYFFYNGKYNIIGYYLFFQSVSLFVAIAGVWMAKRCFNYNFALLFRRFRFSKEIFHKTKSLAFSVLFITLTWVLYYELDSIAIGKMLGANMVAVYAIGLTILGFVRSLLGVFFAPFAARFNHFIGLEQEENLKNFYKHVITITFPLVVFSITAITIMAKGIVISWVGNGYEQSIEIVRWLMLCNILGSISYPAGILLVAKKRVKQMYFVNAIMPVIFWSGIIVTVSSWGVTSFAIFKFAAFTISGMVYLYLSLRFLDMTLWRLVKEIILPYLPGVIILAIALLLMADTFTGEKNKINLLINGMVIIGGISMALLISFFISSAMKNYVINLLHKIKQNEL